MFILSPRLVVVDNDPLMLRTIERQLRQRRITPRLATSVAGAVKLINEAPADLVLSDVDMPGGSGLTLPWRLREVGYSGTVVLMSAFVSLSRREEAQTARVEIFEKPVDLSALLGRLFPAWVGRVQS